MNNLQYKTFFCLIALMMLVSTTSMAQSKTTYTMNVHLVDGTIEQFAVVDVDSVDFSGIATEETSDSCTINGYEYVDLGLSVKWATMNVGANSPEDYGNYYAWGERQRLRIVTQSPTAFLPEFTWTTYRATPPMMPPPPTGEVHGGCQPAERC